jgi:hypothetical protein
LLDGLESAPEQLNRIKQAGVELDEILAELERQGVAAFVEAYNSLLQDLSVKIEKFTS